MGRVKPISEDHIEQTRERILQAVVRILARDVAELSVQAVARESGVSRPTIYRYFASKRAMVEAVGHAYEKRLGVDSVRMPRDLQGLLAEVPNVFARSEALDDTYRAAAWSRVARRQYAKDGARADRVKVMREVLAPVSRGMSPADRERLARVSTVLCSSAVRRAFRDLLGLSTAEAADAVVWALQRLTSGGRR